MKCPRRPEGPFKLPDEDHWDEDDTCSYCGSFNPDTLMKRIEAGELELGPTDKGYKVYLKVLSGEKLKQRYRKDCDCKVGQKIVENKIVDCSAEEIRANVKACPHWVTEERDHGKFYFMHLSEEQMRRFVDLYNEKKLKVGMPGHFYRLPYFMRAADA